MYLEEIQRNLEILDSIGNSMDFNEFVKFSKAITELREIFKNIKKKYNEHSRYMYFPCIKFHDLQAIPTEYNGFEIDLNYLELMETLLKDNNTRINKTAVFNRNILNYREHIENYIKIIKKIENFKENIDYHIDHYLGYEGDIIDVNTPDNIVVKTKSETQIIYYSLKYENSVFKGTQYDYKNAVFISQVLKKPENLDKNLRMKLLPFCADALL